MRFIKKRRFLIIIGIIVVLAFVGFFYFRSKNGTVHETAVVARGQFIQIVSVTGKVKSKTDFELQFPFAGKVSSVFVREGQAVSLGASLAALDTSDFLIDKNQAEADVELRKAELNKLIAKSSLVLDALNLDVEKAYVTLHNDLNSAFSNITSARNMLNSLLNNSQLTSVLPEVSELQSSAIEINVITLGETRNRTDREQNQETIKAYYEETIKQSDHTLTALLLIDKSLNRALPGNAVTRADLDAYAGEVRTRKTSIQTGEADAIAAYAELARARITAQTNIDIARANLKTVESRLEAINKKISDSVLRAPASGVITDVQIEIGERPRLETTVIKMISNDALLVEASIPEADIARVAVGDMASTTLDAYGDDSNFDTEVTHIDPSETIIDGVPTYRTSFRFLKSDTRIKPGMTANIEIVTDRRDNVLAVPARAVVRRGIERFVRVAVDKGGVTVIEEHLVAVGARDSSGNIEILDGVLEGDRIITSLIE